MKTVRRTLKVVAAVSAVVPMTAAACESAGR